MKTDYLLAQTSILLVLLLLCSRHVIGKSLPLTPTRFLLDMSESSSSQASSKGGHGEVNHSKGGDSKEDIGLEWYQSGSSLPDCTHACGPCSPCRRVIVSFRCPMAESCPVVYRCMCRGRYYQVPSN